MTEPGPVRPDLVVLLANYRPDRQESMLRYAAALGRDLQDAGIRTRTVHPPAPIGTIVGRLLPRAVKWAAYVDKYLIFPILLLGLRLRFARTRRTIFHICDHSNAPWLMSLPRRRTIITCHDVIAIRAGRGHDGTFVEASALGRLLQAHILKWLLRSRFVACVSEFTLRQLLALAAEEPQWCAPEADRRVVYNALNADFTPLPEPRRAAALAELGLDPESRFLLHVGSNLPRKNRALLIELAALDDGWSGDICFAGAPMSDEMRVRAAQLDVGHRMREVVRPSHEGLVALYQSCEAFVFPSFSEGFGWPVIEAQALGAVVIASSVEPMPEVGADGAWYADPRDASEFARQVARLEDIDEVAALSQRARLNSRRFASDRILDEYMGFCAAILSA